MSAGEDKVEDARSGPGGVISEDMSADAFDAPARSQAFVVDLDGYEGPLDLLLALVRDHKLDLAQISILDLARQYLES